MTKAINSQLNECGCCETDTQLPALYNEPGQPALAYRLGTHPTFLRRMLSRLYSQTIADGDHAGDRPLSDLNTRSSDDPAIALLDAWAVVADVLAFYQERIANEGYLRTASERRSILELARAIGYELNPGVAASVYLAFTIEEPIPVPGSTSGATLPGLSSLGVGSNNAPAEVIIPAGSKVQSVPGPGEKPQTFETSTEITAKAEWNSLRPRLTRPQELALISVDGDYELYLLGLSTSFPDGLEGLLTISAPDDVYLLDTSLLDGTCPDEGFNEASLDGIKALPLQQLYLEGTSTNLKAGDMLLLVGMNSDCKIITKANSIQRVTAETELNRTRLDLIDNPTPPKFSPLPLATATVSLAAATFNNTQVKSLIKGQAWHESDLNAFLTVQSWSVAHLVTLLAAAPRVELAAASEGIFSFRQRLSFFGHNAPRWDTFPKLATQNARTNADDPYDDSWEGRSIWTNSQGDSWSAGEADAYLERSISEIVNDSWTVFTAPNATTKAYRIGAVTETSLVDYGLSAKVTGLALNTPDGDPISASDKPDQFKTRKTTAHAQSERQTLAQLPIEDALEAGDKSLMLDGLVLELQIGQPLILSGEQSDAPGVIQSEVIILSDIIHEGGYTTLYFQDGLQYGYIRNTVTLNANVALATHGETVANGVLGSGDGAQANQRFVLKRPPLTYVPAATASGGQSTLTVRVNNIEWEEAPSLYGLGANDEKYITRLDDGGNTTIIFGDGLQGARLPTGRENIVATYRSGLGLAGEVAAGSLTTLQSRPLGLRGVTNPVEASGAEDTETMGNARANAPLTVLTMERIVSLQDFEDFARSFAGVGKAKAVVLWNGENNLAHITIASAGGDTVDSTSALYMNLVAAIDRVRNPVQQVRVDTFQPLFFNVKAKVLVDSRYQVEAVLAEAREALLEAFAFAQRAFGQPVTAAEVISVVQGVGGVTAVDLDQLYLITDAGGPNQTVPPAVLPADIARWLSDTTPPTLQLAQLLLINPVGITIEEMTT